VAAFPVAAADVNVSVRRDGAALIIDASAMLEADAATVWQVLTDYERYVDFVPGMKSSRVVARHGANVTVVQSTDSPIWLMPTPLDVTYTITEQPPDRIESSGSGSMWAALDSRYRLVSSAAGIRLDYAGRVTPRSALLGRIEQFAVRQGIVREFEALAREIERKNAERTAAKYPDRPISTSPAAP
jgi:ribosome-associated toxin RatA of RatAB toxin-antitoxin module